MLNINNTIKEITVATLSNPNFFNPIDSATAKIDQACELVKELCKTINE
jgi:hypothetical protein